MSNQEEGWTQIDFERDIEVGERIGGGGVGVIYKGWLKGEPVALKTLFDPRVDEKLKKEYMDELLVMSKLKHSNIVSFLGASMVPPNLCFVMELCRESLYDQIHKQRINFSDHEIISIATDIGYAMEYLHSQKPSIIHRDLKSLNVVISYDGVAKICDFGLVKNTCTTAGTPAYMAPELLENKQYNRSVDSYAFGILLWELYTGEIPFYCMDVADIRNKVIAGGRPTIPSTIPRRSANLIRDCWSQNRSERLEFYEIVDELLDIEKTVPESKFTEQQWVAQRAFHSKTWLENCFWCHLLGRDLYHRLTKKNYNTRS